MANQPTHAGSNIRQESPGESTRRAQLQADASAKLAESAMAARNAAFQMGVPIGAIIDTTQGFDVRPMVPAPLLPTVGETTTNYRHPGSSMVPPEMAADIAKDPQTQADLAALMGHILPKGGGPPIPPAAPPPQVRPQTAAAPIKIHPILEQLRVDIGINEEKSVEVTVGGHKWRMVVPSPDLVAIATSITEMVSVTKAEFALRSKYAIAACSIIGIDNTPTWVVMNVVPEKTDNIESPFFPVGVIRRRAALKLLDELMTGSLHGAMHRLNEAYEKKVDPKGRVKGYMDYDKRPHFLWECKVDNCNHQLVEPKRLDGNNEELPLFCQYHGTEMTVRDELPTRVGPELDPLR